MWQERRAKKKAQHRPEKQHSACNNKNQKTRSESEEMMQMFGFAFQLTKRGEPLGSLDVKYLPCWRVKKTRQCRFRSRSRSALFSACFCFRLCVAFFPFLSGWRGRSLNRPQSAMNWFTLVTSDWGVIGGISQRNPTRWMIHWHTFDWRFWQTSRVESRNSRKFSFFTFNCSSCRGLLMTIYSQIAFQVRTEDRPATYPNRHFDSCTISMPREMKIWMRNETQWNRRLINFLTSSCNLSLRLSRASESEFRLARHSNANQLRAPFSSLVKRENQIQLLRKHFDP